MSYCRIPDVFRILLSSGYISESDIVQTEDGFCLIYKSISDILAEKCVYDFVDSDGERLLCDKFFDDWFLYAVPFDKDFVYSLLKLREQENDAENGTPADGDTPGVTISFVDFSYKVLLDCLENPDDENRKILNSEINRVVAYRGQCHHKALKKYFKNSQSQGAYLTVDIYTKYIASFAEEGCLEVPECYREIVQQSISYKTSLKLKRLPSFIEFVNKSAGYTVCDNAKIYIKDPKNLTKFESAAILATHTGNTSQHSFAAEVEYHAKFLTPLAKIKIPFLGRSIYDSAIRADMTVADTEFQGPAPFYRSDSKIVKRHRALHKND